MKPGPRVLINKKEIAEKLKTRPVVTCKNKIYKCSLCPAPIKPGDKYHNGSTGQRAHEVCVHDELETHKGGH